MFGIKGLILRGVLYVFPSCAGRYEGLPLITPNMELKANASILAK